MNFEQVGANLNVLNKPLKLGEPGNSIVNDQKVTGLIVTAWQIIASTAWELSKNDQLLSVRPIVVRQRRQKSA